jgi:hypothetical protein
MAWKHDYDPALTIDHIDGDPTNNHVTNLRMVTFAENTRAYGKLRTTNTSGYRGVSPAKAKGRWFGQIMKDYQWYGVGTYDSQIQAAFARDLKAVQLGFPKEGLNFPENYNRYMWELNSQQTLKI